MSTRAISIDGAALRTMGLDDLPDAAASIEAVGPGDVIVVELSEPWPPESMSNTYSLLKRAWPNNEIVLCPSTARIKVARTASPTATEFVRLIIVGRRCDNGDENAVLSEALVRATLRDGGLYASVASVPAYFKAVGYANRVDCQWLRHESVRHAYYHLPSTLLNQASAGHTFDLTRNDGCLIRIYG